MTPQQKELVKQTWTMVVPIADTAAELFYGRLFELDPSVKPMFKGDMKEQGAKLMKTIGIAVSALDDLEPLIATLKDMGEKHAGYGVKDADYDTVAAALLWTLEKGLGEAFTDEVKNAWAAVYTILADVMKQGASEAKAA
ncbi:MAG: globin family protein [Gammaproteobacteria bacterium]